jgi:hypothetical protein
VTYDSEIFVQEGTNKAQITSSYKPLQDWFKSQTWELSLCKKPMEVHNEYDSRSGF